MISLSSRQSGGSSHTRSTSWTACRLCYCEPLIRLKLTNRTSARTDDDVSRFAFVKLAEMLSGSQPEPQPGRIITLATPLEAPKIRITAEPAPPPVPAQPVKLTLKKKVPKAQSTGLSDTDMVAISNALRKLVSGLTRTALITAIRQKQRTLPSACGSYSRRGSRLSAHCPKTYGSFNGRSQTRVGHVQEQTGIRQRYQVDLPELLPVQRAGNADAPSGQGFRSGV